MAEGGSALAGDTQAQIPAHGHVGSPPANRERGQRLRERVGPWACRAWGASPRCNLNADVRQQELLCEYHLLWYEIRHP